MWSDCIHILYNGYNRWKLYQKDCLKFECVSSRGKYLEKKMIYVCVYNPCQQTDSCLINTGGIYQVGTRLQMTRQDGLMYINSIY